MTFRVSLAIDGNARGATQALKQTEAGIDGVERAARMGGVGTKGYADALGNAYNIQGKLTQAQVASIRQYETLIGRSELLRAGMGREASQFTALRKAQTTADTEYGRVIADLAGRHYDLSREQEKAERSGSNLANTLTRRFVLGYVVSQARAAASAILNLNSELAKVGDTAARTGVSAANLQGLQTAAAYKGVDGTQFLESMLQFNQQVARAQHGVGELYLLLRANGTAAKGVEDAFGKVADLVRNASSEAEKFDILRQAGLPASREFVKLMEQGSAAIKEQADQAEKFSEEQLRAAKKIDESFNKLWVDFSRGAKKAVFDVGGFLDELAVKAREAVLWGEKAGSAAARSMGLGLVKNKLGTTFGAADASSFYDAVGSFSANSQSTRQGKTKNPEQDKLDLQRDIQNLSILGQTITATEARTLAEKQLDLAVANGASIDKERRKILGDLAYQRALGIDQIRASADTYRVEAATIGMKTGAAEAYRAAETKINEELRKGNELRPGQIAEIRREAAALGEAAQRTEDLRWGYENLVRGPLQTMRSEIAAGKSGFQALEATGAKALESISTKLTDMAARELWSAAFPGSKGSGFSLAALLGGGGGSSAATASSYMMGGTVVPVFHSGRQPGVPPREWRGIDPQVFATAPRFHAGRSPWFAAGELPAIIKEDEWVIPDNKVRRAGNGGGGNSYYYDNRTFNDVTPDVMARLEARLRQEKPLWIKDALRAMQSQRSVNPHAYSPGGGS